MIYGYGLIDEYLIACILLGTLFSLVKYDFRKNKPQNNTRLSRLHFQVFFFFMCYLVLQSFRGLIVLDDLRMIRFVIFFMMLGTLSYVIFRGFFPLPSLKQTLKTMLVSTILYFVFYLGHGVLAESVRAMSRFNLQGHEWAGSSVAMFPIFTAIPAVYFVLRKKSGVIGNASEPPRPQAGASSSGRLNMGALPPNPRLPSIPAHRAGHPGLRSKQMWIAWAVILLATGNSFFYDSRISWVAIIGFLILSLRDLGVYRSLSFFIIFVIFLIILSVGIQAGDGIIAEIGDFFKSLSLSGLGLQPSDADRKLQILAAFRSINDDIATFFFGTGFYTERYTLVQYYIETLTKFGLPSSGLTIARVSTFSSFIAGTGVIGFFLLVLCFILTALEIIVYTGGPNKKGRKILLFTLLMVFFSANVSINLDLILFYLCIMPSGILVQLSKYETIR